MYAPILAIDLSGPVFVYICGVQEHPDHFCCTTSQLTALAKEGFSMLCCVILSCEVEPSSQAGCRAAYQPLLVSVLQHA